MFYPDILPTKLTLTAPVCFPKHDKFEYCIQLERAAKAQISNQDGNIHSFTETEGAKYCTQHTCPTSPNEEYTMSVTATNTFTDDQTKVTESVTVKCLDPVVNPKVTVKGSHIPNYETIFEVDCDQHGHRPCCLIDFGDGTVEMYGHNDCQVGKPDGAKFIDVDDVCRYDIPHIYNTKGDYDVKVSVGNCLAAPTEIEKRVSINGCEHTDLQLNNAGTETTPKELKKCEKIEMDIAYDITCNTVTQNAKISWAFFKVVAGVKTEITNQLTIENVNPGKVLYIPKRVTRNVFETGETYIVKVKVTASNMPDVSVEVDGYFIINQCPLVCQIKGGATRALPLNRPYTLDLSGSYDPDASQDNLDYECASCEGDGCTPSDMKSTEQISNHALESAGKGDRYVFKCVCHSPDGKREEAEQNVDITCPESPELAIN